MPFIGVGFGSDQGVRTLSLREVEAPSMASPKTAFSIAAQLEMINTEEMPGFRPAAVSRRADACSRKLSAGQRLAHLAGELPGDRRQAGRPQLRGAVAAAECARPEVREHARQHVGARPDEQELRVLYIQGALTWDYKFVSLALRNDQTIKLTGLTRTSQAIRVPAERGERRRTDERLPDVAGRAGALPGGGAVESAPADLTPAQQEVLARFCGELGGGVLMIGGPATFDGSWQSSRLEQLLPVVFSRNRGVQGLDRPFRLQLTEEALAAPGLSNRG